MQTGGGGSAEGPKMYSLRYFLTLRTTSEWQKELFQNFPVVQTDFCCFRDGALPRMVEMDGRSETRGLQLQGLD